MDIEITNPIHITMEVIELDEHIPSLKFNVMIRVKKFGYSADVSSQLWIECQCFDEFIGNMRNGNTALLKDINSYFELLLDPALSQLEWSCAKEDLDGNVTISKGKEKLTENSTSAIYTAFNEYPRWW